MNIVATDDNGAGGTTGGSTGTTGGSTTGSTATTGSTGGTTTTGGDFGDASSVIVKIYEIDLLSTSGNVVVFEDPDGVDVDLKGLRDLSGARFQFLSNATIPYGTYTGFQVTFSENFTSVVNTVKFNKRFTDAVLDGHGHAIVTYNFNQPFVVDAGTTYFAIDFDLAHWVDNNGIVTPHLVQGSTDGVTDPNRQQTVNMNGFTLNVVSGQSFDVRHGHQRTHFLMNVLTQVTGKKSSVANNQHVRVTAVFDPSNKTLRATVVNIK